MSRESIYPAYEALKNQFELTYTNTFAMENGREDFDEDFEIMCGNSPAGKFMLWHDGCLFIFDVTKTDGTYTHWHPYDIQDVIADIQAFMQGHSRY